MAHATRSDHPYAITDEMVDDILTAALEGGITYWADAAKIIGDWPDGKSRYGADPSDSDLFLSEVLTHGSDVAIHEPEEDTWHTLTLAKMKRGIRHAAKQYGKTPLALYEDHDAGVADNIVQYALFGELIYG
jgi:hypothetical protein